MMRGPGSIRSVWWSGLMCGNFREVPKTGCVIKALNGEGVLFKPSESLMATPDGNV